MKLLLATRNQDKIKEIKAVLKNTDLEFLTLEQVAPKLIIPENARTLEANARKKASLAMQSTQLPSLAEDTGLEVFALEGAPGVYSARYAGPKAKYEDNVNKLLQKMESIPPNQRKARFRTIFILAIPGRKTYQFQGICNGEITTKPKGKSGFGYDSIFKPTGYRMTFGQMSIKMKNRISHRAKALRKVKIFLNKYFNE
jgi:XTP/dITP diphosphohydrolase